MSTNVAVEKGGNESNTGLIRRFTKRVNESGVLRRARSLRFRSNDQSPYLRKKQALKMIGRREEYERLAKLGKAPKKKRGRRRR